LCSKFTEEILGWDGSFGLLGNIASMGPNGGI
jgi:hypothetical protein